MPDKPMIVNVFGLDSDDLAEGSALVFYRTWLRMGEKVRVIMINKGISERVISHSSTNCLEFVIKTVTPSKNQYFQKLASKSFGHYGPNQLLNLDSFFFALRCLLTFGPTLRSSRVVHTYNFWFAFLAVTFGYCKRKIVYTELGGEWAEVAERRASFLVKLRYNLLGKRILSQLRVIAQSELNKKFMVMSGIPSANISVVRHARSDPNLFRPTAEKRSGVFRVLYVGRIVPQKGLHILVEASNIVIRRLGIENIHISVVGPTGGFGYNSSTAYSQRIERLIDLYELNRYYTFMGHIKLEDLVDLYSSSDVYVMPSIQDAMPSSVTEAQMCGTPVIGTRSGGMTELIEDGTTGFLIPPNDPRALAEKLEYLYRNRVKCKEMGNYARTRAVALFSMENFHSDLLETLLG